MSLVSRFPHYHQPENIVTNHVMVMLRTIYETSPKLLQSLLQALTSQTIEIGPRFAQQISGSHSVPDGVISQSGFSIAVETKLGAKASDQQLVNHCKTIASLFPEHTTRVLISLTSALTPLPLAEAVEAEARQHGISLVRTSFRDLLAQLQTLGQHDLGLSGVIDEFADFIVAQGLIPRVDYTMVGVLTGTSWRENVAHGVYYDPAERFAKWKRASFMGFYHNKVISHVGRISVVVCGSDPDGSGNLELDQPEYGELTPEIEKRIIEAVAAAQEYYPNFQHAYHRFYVIDDPVATSFRKITPNGMMGHRYFDVEEASGQKISQAASSAEVARVLEGCTFS